MRTVENRTDVVEGTAADYMIDLDKETWARWDAEAERRGRSLDELVHEAVEAFIEGKIAEPWTGVERRRDRRTVLDATGTRRDEHKPDA